MPNKMFESKTRLPLLSIFISLPCHEHKEILLSYSKGFIFSRIISSCFCHQLQHLLQTLMCGGIEKQELTVLCSLLLSDYSRLLQRDIEVSNYIVI